MIATNQATDSMVATSSSPVEATATAPAERLTSDQRKELVARQVASQVRSGRRVESQSDFQAVIVYGHRVNHILHFLLGFVTFGLWWLVWIMLAIGGGERRELVAVDERGLLTVQRV